MGCAVIVKGLKSSKEMYNGCHGIISSMLDSGFITEYAIKIGCGNGECAGLECGDEYCDNEVKVAASALRLVAGATVKQGTALLLAGALEQIDRQGPRECLPYSIQSALRLPYIPKPKAPAAGDYADASERGEVLSSYMGAHPSAKEAAR